MLNNSRTYDSLRIPSALIRQLNFTQNDLCATSDKNKFHYLEKIIYCIVHMYVKLGLQFRYAVEQFNFQGNFRLH